MNQVTSPIVNEKIAISVSNAIKKSQRIIKPEEFDLYCYKLEKKNKAIFIKTMTSKAYYAKNRIVYLHKRTTKTL